MWRTALVSAVALLAAWAAPAGAQGAPLGLTACTDVEGVHRCDGVVETWDGVPLDTTLVLPRAGARDLPLVVAIHGFGNSKHEYLDAADEAYTGNAYGWAREGYAVLAYTARGLWGSCGTPDVRLAAPAPCARGYVRLADVRYEVRDAQHLIGLAVDAGVADPRRIGATGDSYGGGQSLMLASLRDEVVRPDGSRAPWHSPAGTPLRLAAAAPVIPWSDLIGAIAPNGRTRTTAVLPREHAHTPVGVFKISFANGIAAAAQFATGPGQPVGEPFVPGRPMGQLAPPGTDPEADVLGWVARADAGEPYDTPDARAVVDTLERFHSAYQLHTRGRPAPLLLAGGFTDDLFPASETIRQLNRVRRTHPRTPVSLVLGDFGHQRASQKPQARAALLDAIRAWFGEHLRGGPRARRGVTATTQTCPRDAPPGGPFRARSFWRLARSEARGRWGDAQTVSWPGGDPATARALDPVTGGGDACVAPANEAAAGTAVYELPAAGPEGFTLLGAPAISARISIAGDAGAAQVAARLWDVAPGGATRTLVARGLYRPRAGRQAWELFPAGWHFARGHRPQLELLGGDPPFGRASNGTFTLTVERLALSLPARERPDCVQTLPRAAPVVPRGQRRAPGVPRRVRGRRCRDRR